jgi:hypothetical protein
MNRCSSIKANGERCGSVAMRGEQWCYVHNPNLEEARQRNNSKGGRRAGRGRPQVEIARICDRIEEIAEGILAGEIDKGPGAVAGQLLNYVLGGLRIGLQAQEQEELIQRLEVLEATLEHQDRRQAW